MSYTVENIRNLATKHGIAIGNEGRLMESLDQIGNLYLLSKGSEERPTGKKVAVKRLNSIEKKARELLDEISNLPFDTKVALYDKLGTYPYEDLTAIEALRRIETTNSESVGDFPFGPQSDESDLSKIRHSLDLLQSKTRITVSSYPTSQPGPASDRPLLHWALNFHSIWTSILKQEYTVLQHNGEPVSKTAEFGCDAFYLIHPDLEEQVPQNKIVNKLRDAQNILQSYLKS